MDLVLRSPKDTLIIEAILKVKLEQLVSESKYSRGLIDLILSLLNSDPMKRTLLKEIKADLVNMYGTHLVRRIFESNLLKE